MEKKRILVIEDEQDVIRVLAARLTSAGFAVITACDAVQGIQFAHKENPDLIILDLKLPAGNGLSVLNNLRLSAYLKNTPIVILTGIRDEEYKRAVIESGVEGYFEKPYDADEFLGHIKDLLGEKGKKEN